MPNIPDAEMREYRAELEEVRSILKEQDVKVTELAARINRPRSRVSRVLNDRETSRPMLQLIRTALEAAAA